MKYKLLFAALVAASSLNAQSFVAGWDFDDVALDAPSATATWGDLAGAATASWTHSPAGGPPLFTAEEFGVDNNFNSATIGNTFAFADPNTGFVEFTNGAPAAEKGFFSDAAGESITLSFDGSQYLGLSLSYAVDDGNGWTAVTGVDLSSLEGNLNAQFVLNTGDGFSYDNFAITATSVVPEPSSFAAIFGVLALAFTASRRRK